VQYGTLFGEDRCQRLKEELETDRAYLGVEFYLLLEDALAAIGVGVKFVVFQPVPQPRPRPYIQGDMLVVPHQAFTDSAVEKIAGWTAMFVVLTDVDSPEAHYTVMHVKSNYTGDTDFMTSVKIQISPAEVVDGWLQNTKEDGNCAPYCAATHLNWAKVPYPPLYAANFTAVVKSVMSPKKPASEASGGDQVNVSTAVAAVAKVASLVDQRRGLDNLWRNLLSTKDPSPTWFLKK
jgi:hypothetical protein